jgi:hypothetical protein
MAEAKTTFSPEEKNGVAAALSKKTLDYLTSLLPTNARIFVDSVIRGESSSITEKDFTPDELDAIRDLILASKTEGKVTYEAYGALQSEKPLEWWQRPPKTAGGFASYPMDEGGGGGINILDTLTPEGRIKTTLGQFGYRKTPGGDVVVGDVYDFYPLSSGWDSVSTGEQIMEGIRTLGYTPLRVWAGEAIPEGEDAGRKVNIVIPKEQFSGKEYAVLFPMDQSR